MHQHLHNSRTACANSSSAAAFPEALVPNAKTSIPLQCGTSRFAQTSLLAHNLSSAMDATNPSINTRTSSSSQPAQVLPVDLPRETYAGNSRGLSIGLSNASPSTSAARANHHLITLHSLRGDIPFPPLPARAAGRHHGPHTSLGSFSTKTCTADKRTSKRTNSKSRSGPRAWSRTARPCKGRTDCNIEILTSHDERSVQNQGEQLKTLQLKTLPKTL